MLIRNTAERFGLVSKTLHWLTLVLLVGAFSLAISMVNMPFSPRKLEFYSWHKWVGVTIFLVVLLRLAWRLVNPVPAQPGSVPQWQRRLAGLSHATLYMILIVMPITGWIMSSALNLPVVYLGLVHIPSPFGVDRTLGETMKIVHLSLAIALLVLVSIHALAALYHHLVLRDDVLRRMLPWPAPLRTPAPKP
ncbi:cytochrome b [Pseudorhodoplanes sp.]|uniref:cytochrome b n=1 Tax=Pseudorhodoplanes sp. TaxID=1934341 RepID=UPI003D1136CE